MRHTEAQGGNGTQAAPQRHMCRRPGAHRCGLAAQALLQLLRAAYYQAAGAGLGPAGGGGGHKGRLPELHRDGHRGYAPCEQRAAAEGEWNWASRQWARAGGCREAAVWCLTQGCKGEAVVQAGSRRCRLMNRLANCAAGSTCSDAGSGWLAGSAWTPARRSFGGLPCLQPGSVRCGCIAQARATPRGGASAK